MSQQQFFNSGGSGPITPNILFLQGNDAVDVGPNAITGVIFVLGDNSQGINITNTGANTETVTVFNASTSQKGTILLASNAEALAGTNTTKAMTPQDVQVKVGTQTTNGLAYGAGASAAINWLAAMTNGQLPIGNTGNPPTIGSITSIDGSITVTLGPGTIDLSVTDTHNGTATTVGATTANIITIPLGGTPGTFQFEARVKAFESTTPTGAGYNVFATFITDGTTATLIGNQDTFNESTTLDTADSYFLASGNNAVLQVLGVTALTINWVAETQIT
jgi:hypothetical protein